MTPILLCVVLCMALHMTAQATFLRHNGQVKRTAGSAINAGDLIELEDGRAAMALTAIDNGAVGQFLTEGHIAPASASGTTFSLGDRVWWDVSAGAAVAQSAADPTAGDFAIGSCIKAKVSGDLSVETDLNAADSAELETLTLDEGANIVVGTATGTQIGTATAQKLAFHGSTPVIQRAGAAQAAVATTGASNSSPYGFTTAAQADAIVALVNELRAALVAKGIIKGAA